MTSRMLTLLAFRPGSFETFDSIVRTDRAVARDRSRHCRMESAERTVTLDADRQNCTLRRARRLQPPMLLQRLMMAQYCLRITLNFEWNCDGCDIDPVHARSDREKGSD